MKSVSRIAARIDLDAIEENFRQMRANIEEGTRMVAVIKADGYGHGAVRIARLVEHYDYLWGFAVATTEEAVQLREHGIRKPVMILGFVFEEDYGTVVRYDLRPTVFTFSMAKALSDAGGEAEKKVHVHIALDTGMSRIGFSDTEESVRQIQDIFRLPWISVEGMFTHFARADEVSLEPARLQLERYLKFRTMLENAGIDVGLRHCSNSAGIMQFPEANLDLVRAGISIYGLYPSDEVCREPVHLTPAMSLISHISYLKTLDAGVAVSYGGTYITEKKTKVATIPVGYADGYARALSNKGYVLIRGRRAPIIGRVCMDQFMVDVTQIEGVRELDKVTLIGQDGSERITMELLGELSGRFNYEFACCINKRVPRVYVKDGKIE